MITLSRLKEQISEIVSKIEIMFPNTKTYCINLVGSTVEKYKSRNSAPFYIHDVDIFIFTIEPAEEFTQCILRALVKDSIAYRNIDELNIWTFKCINNSICFSIHVVDYTSVRNIVKQHDDPNIYDISLVSFKLNYPTVYRTWIIDAICIGGNDVMLHELQCSLLGKIIPKESAIQLKEKILQYIDYARELHKDEEFAHIIIINQLLEKLISLCYVENSMYYGTLKSLDEDIKHFDCSKRLVCLCREIVSNFQWMRDNGAKHLDLIESVIKYEIF